MSSEPINWHIDPSALAEHYREAAEQPYPDGEGLLLHPSFGQAEGYREIIRIGDGLYVMLSDLVCHEETRIDVGFDVTLKFHFRIEGSTALGMERGEASLEHHTMGVLLQPDEGVKYEHYLAGERERSVTLICEQEFLHENFAADAQCLPVEIADFIHLKSLTPYHAQFTMRADMVIAASNLLNNEFHGALRKSYCHAKGLELLVLSLQCMADHVAQEAEPGKMIPTRDLTRMNKVRDRLEQDYVNPPTISELARETGINDAKLMHLFKQLYGETIFDFTQNLRMDAAKRLLETTEKSITEIAFDVGYEYSSNFTTAFKRRFGLTPSVARDAFRKV